MKRALRLSGSWCCAWVIAALGMVAFAPAARADKIHIDDYVERGSFHFPAPPDTADVLADGRLVVLSGTEVFEETTARSRTFVSLGNLPDADFNEFGATFFKVSPDGHRVAVGNNGGADFDHFQVGIFHFPALTGTWFDANSAAATWIDDRFLAITAGVFGTPSIVTAFDTDSTDPAHPVNPTIVANIGGASGGIAFDQHENLYTANGFATTGPSTTGTIKAFPRAAWRAALHGRPPVDFEADGTTIVTVLAGSPLAFDASDNLFVGGGDFFGGGDINFAAFISHHAVKHALHGGGPVDTADLAQVRKVDPSAATGSEYDVIVNRKRSEVYLRCATAEVFVYRAE